MEIGPEDIIMYSVHMHIYTLYILAKVHVSYKCIMGNIALILAGFIHVCTINVCKY